MINAADIVFWTSLVLIAFTYAGYPAVCLAAGMLFSKRFKRCDYDPSVSVIVACYNEEAVIRQKIENLLGLSYPKDKLQILVASESTDATNTIVKAFEPQGVQLYSYAVRSGKTVMLFDTVPRATGDILVFSDANVLLAQNALARLTAYFCDSRVGAVTAKLTVTNPKESDISWGEHLYKQYETFLRRANSRMGRVLNPDGALFAIRRELYRPVNRQRGDDFELVVRVLIQGKASVFADDALSYEDASVTTTAEISRKIRMVSWFTRSTFMLLGEMLIKGRITLAAQVIAHKSLRWLTPFFFIALFYSNMMLTGNSVAYLAFFTAQSAGYCLGITGWYIAEVRKKKPPFVLKAAHYFLTYNYAFLIGTIKGILPGMTSSAWGKVRR